MRNLKGFEDFVYERRMKNTTNVVNEGGAYGHLSHPYEDSELTFGDMKEICNLTINGLFTTDNMVAEKTDGQIIDLLPQETLHISRIEEKMHLVKKKYPIFLVKVSQKNSSKRG